ncbi:hypothetical protein EIK76_00470 [Rheinheimera mesophila]|uniref:Uncharacterized protein n=1 Tax=Rheinheimera mesophila TaxID=1547515 RepID=A0A3P3QNL2_9GAMM|nr:phage tail protein [Rheinheimera mesophila]RRJ22595.1 hypothetical protein EIK76_00470 [Rheinheimera mesophila]
MGFFSGIWKAVTKPFKKILSWLVPTPDMPAAQAVTVEKQGSDHPIPVVYGTRRIGGIKVHKYVTDADGGAKNEFLHLIIVFCEGPIEAISELYFDGVSEVDPRWNKQGGGKWFTVQRCNGAYDQAPLTTGIPNWTADHRLQGLAYIHLRLQMDESQSVWRGEPEVTARIAGRKIYDPRNGQTAYSENLPLQLLDYLTNTTYGKGLSLSRLLQQSFIESAHWADEQITSDVTINGVTSAVTHARITGNLVIDTGKSVFSNVKQMLSGMRGMMPIGSGQLRLVCEKEGDPVFFFGHGHSVRQNYALITGPIKSKAGRKNDRYNRVIIRFPNKLTNYERDEVHYPDANDPLFAEWLAEDNGVLLEQSFEFDTITNKAEAYQMAEIVAKRSRNRMEVSFTASPPAIVVEPGDIVGISDDTRGWDEKPFRVEQCKLREDGDVDFEFIEHQNAIYPWSGVAYSDRVGGTNLGDPTNIPAPTALNIVVDPTFNSGGRLLWSSESNAFIRRYVVKIEQSGNTIFERESFVRNIDLPRLAVGSYTIKVYAVGTLGTWSPPANISFNVTVPLAPTDIQFTVGNFEIEARPVLSGAGLGTEFEFAIDTTDVVRGRGISMVFAGLQYGTEYTIFARTVNYTGSSAWVSRIATTTANASNIVDLIGEDVGASIFDDVLAQVQAGLQEQIDAAVGEVPTVAEVQQIIDDALAIVEQAEGEDARVSIIEQINSIFDDGDRRAEIKQVSILLQTETITRASQVLQLQAGANAQLVRLDQVESQADGTAETLSIVQGKVDNATTGLSATFTLAQQAKTTADGATTALNSLSATVTNPTTGLSATNQLAQQAKTTADGATSSINSLTATVNNPTSGLSATNPLAQQAKTTADGATSAINSLTATVNNSTTGLSATNQLAQQAKTTADGAVSATTQLSAQVNNLDGELALASLSLQATIDELGNISGRAYLGVTTTVGGVSTVTGLVVDGATNTLEFRANTFRLSNSAGAVQLYWDSGRQKWVFVGDLVGNNFQTATSGYRAEMGNGAFPFWYGTGTKNLANALFAVDSLGNVTIRNVSIQGKLVTSEGTGTRIEVWNDGTYLIWAGSGAKTDVNALFFIKANGTGFIKSEFFAGKIIESKSGSGSSTSGAILTVFAGAHSSDGFPVEISANAYVSAKASGNLTNKSFIVRLVLKRNGTAIATFDTTLSGSYESLDAETYWSGNAGATFIDTLATAGTRNYSVEVSMVGTASPFTLFTRYASIKTFENKLPS